MTEKIMNREELSKTITEIQKEFNKLHLSVYGNYMTTHESNMFGKLFKALALSQLALDKDIEGLINKAFNNLEDARSILMQKGVDISFMYDDFNEIKQALSDSKLHMDQLEEYFKLDDEITVNNQGDEKWNRWSELRDNLKSLTTQYSITSNQVPSEVVTAIDELHAFACQSPDIGVSEVLKITKVIENHLGIRMEVKK